VLLGLLSAGLLLSKSGDAFLAFIGEELHIDITYRNHSGFISCYLLRFIELASPVFVIKDFDVALGCREAYLIPDFSEVFSEKAITLECAIKDASFLEVEKKIKDVGDLDKYFDKDTLRLLSGLLDMLFQEIFVKIKIYGTIAEIKYFTAYSKTVRIFASGVIEEDKGFELKAKIFISPTLAAKLPAEVVEFLTEKSRGWFSYSFHIVAREDRPFLKFESDRFRINFEKVEVK